MNLDSIHDNQTNNHNIHLRTIRNFCSNLCIGLLHPHALNVQDNVDLFTMLLQEYEDRIYMALHSTKIKNLNFMEASNMILISSWYQNSKFTIQQRYGCPKKKIGNSNEFLQPFSNAQSSCGEFFFVCCFYHNVVKECN